MIGFNTFPIGRLGPARTQTVFLLTRSSLIRMGMLRRAIFTYWERVRALPRVMKLPESPTIRWRSSSEPARNRRRPAGRGDATHANRKPDSNGNGNAYGDGTTDGNAYSDGAANVTPTATATATPMAHQRYSNANYAVLHVHHFHRRYHHSRCYRHRQPL